MAQQGKGRLDPRVAVKIRVDIQYPPRGITWCRAETIDISASGGCLRCDRDIPLKAQVGCRIYLPPVDGQEDQLIDCEAVVVRVDTPEPGSKEWRYGLYFLGLEGPNLQAIRRFVFASV